MTTARHDTTWDATRYLSFADHRARPFHDLVSRVAHPGPEFVVDLGCGPGNATATLVDRWPDARVLGVDSSMEMIEAATRRAASDRLEFQLSDLREWVPPRPVDVLLCNAVLQWVPDHLAVLPRLASLLAPGGVFAFQVPGNFDEASHRIIAELVESPPWRGVLTGELAWPSSYEPMDYLLALDALGLAADAWSTSYTYVLEGEDGLTNFVRSTGLRPVLNQLEPEQTRAFLADYQARARIAYPPRRFGGRTVQLVPYRRIFALGQAAGTPSGGR